MKKIILGYVLFFIVLFTLFYENRMDLRRTDNYSKHQSDTGVHTVANIEDKTFYVYDTDEGWRELFLAGVNLGAGKPGYFPGNFGITKSDYLRWFQYISEMNANTIRVYVLQMPEFYQALKEYNETAEKPLYLMHGVYMNEADILQYQDAWAEDGLIRKSFLRDIENIVDVIHGNASIEQITGNAGGIYNADISRYVIGWILGIEWEVEFVRGTNENNPQYTSYDGQYLYAENVTPFEVMLAEAADTAICYEMAQYKEQRPLAMSNWVTSDPLDHPGEPNPEVEDAVSVDMENIHAKEGFEAGFFASYHVYPYYPDMFNYNQAYLQDDPPNSYRAYIRELNTYHTMPVLISEVGIPASRGIAHENIHTGFNQGHITETEQGEMLVSMIGDIYDEGLMGAIIFSWQDEWFKKTWNTQAVTLPERRPFWMDYQTNEQSFGLLAFDPGDNVSISYVDGDISEWSEEDVVVENDNTRLSVKSDEKFLYLMVTTDKFNKEVLYLPINIIPGQGNTTYNGVSLGMGADFMLRLDGENNSTVLVDPYYDVTYYEYAVQSTIMDRVPSREQTDTAAFVPITLMLNRGLMVPESGEIIPYETFDTGKLRYGIANPDMEGFDSIADFYYNNGAVEIRLPWLLLNIIDPSTKQILGNLYENGGFVSQDAGSIGIGMYFQSDAQNIVQGRYEWDAWEMPAYHERLKESYAVVQAFYADIPEAALRTRSTAELFWERWNQTQFAYIGFWFPIQPMLNYVLVFLLSIIVYFFLVLLYIHALYALQSRRRQRLQRRICDAVEGTVPTVYSLRHQYYTVHGLRRPFSRASLLMFSKLLEESDEFTKGRIRKLMLDMGYDEYVTKQLHTRDMKYLILIVRLIGELHLKERAGEVKALLYKHKNDTDFEYQALLALALLGDFEGLVAIAMDETFVQTLSFRSLQEIFKSFDGDKEKLYGALLDSPDTFIQRITIKRIGIEGFVSHAEKMIPYLDAGNYNVVIDAARTLGQLRYKPAAPQITGLLAHKQWEVRAVAVNSLACIDTEKYEKELVQVLSDPEWQVRSNAAQALSTTPQAARILEEVADSGDRYAYEVLKYMVTTRGIWEGK